MISFPTVDPVQTLQVKVKTADFIGGVSCCTAQEELSAIGSAEYLQLKRILKDKARS